MAEKCICCGKKIGLLNGSHLNNQVCDNCYFPIVSYLTAIKESSTIQTMEKNYNHLVQKVKLSQYSENGKDYIVKAADKFFNDNKNSIQIKVKNAQTRKDFKITTSYNFEGYKIFKYYGIASGSITLGTGFLSEGRAAVSDFLGEESSAFSDKLDQARNSSLNRMIDNAISLGGNALIGVSFDYITFSSNMIGVIANGTAVEIIEQQELIAT